MKLEIKNVLISKLLSIICKMCQINCTRTVEILTKNITDFFYDFCFKQKNKSRCVKGQIICINFQMNSIEVYKEYYVSFIGKWPSKTKHQKFKIKCKVTKVNK